MKRPFSRNRCRAALIVLGFVVMAHRAHAQSGGVYSIPWSTVDGGGGSSMSTDGRYAISGTIGQPDVSLVSLQSGHYELAPGFWVNSGVTVPALALFAAAGLGLTLLRLSERRLRGSRLAKSRPLREHVS
jgi:hypothetical protein